LHYLTNEVRNKIVAQIVQIKAWQAKIGHEILCKRKFSATRSVSFVFRYLQEIGYTDTIIDVRSARIRQMLGLPARDNKDDLPSNPVKGDLISGKRPIETQGSR